MIRILVADDHPVVRTGLKLMINEEYDMSVTGEAVNGTEVLKEIQEKEFDLILLDISMPGESGLDILKQIKYSHPKLPVLILSTYPEELYAERSLKSGASGYLNKQFAPNELALAVRKIIRGGKFISPSIAENMALKMIDHKYDQPHEALSDREFQVLIMIGKGKTVTEISNELMLSDKTVSTYRARILEKMSLKTTAELIKYAVDQKLVD